MKRHIASSSIACAAIIVATCALSTGPAFAHSALAAGTTTNQLPTITALTVSVPITAYGEEQLEHVSVTVNGGGGTPTGIVTITDGATTLCTVSLTAGAGSCTPLTASQLGPGDVTLVASYSGDPTYAPSAAAGDFVVQVPTTTTLKLSSATVASFEPAQALHASVTVTEPDGFTPAGTVDVAPYGLNPSTGCTATLVPGTVPGTAVGSCTATVYADGFPDNPYGWFASYEAARPGFGGSSAGAPFTVVLDPTTTTLRLSAPKIVYGHEQSERATITVTPKYPARLVSGVAVSAGSKVLCFISTLTPAAVARTTGSCLLPASALSAGSPALTASYSGSTYWGIAASSASTRVTVTKATTRVALKLSASTVVYGHEQSERFSVTVSPQYAGALSGTVTIGAGRTTLCRITITYGKGTGTCSPSAKALRTGRYTIIAVYSGNGDYSGATSSMSYLTIKP